jgi:branched-chain amino acid transport system substrate-binding protein
MKRTEGNIDPCILVPSLVSPVTAEEELTLAAVLPLTGQFGAAGQEGAAAQRDTVAIINEEGGINGKKLKYVIEDGHMLDVGNTGRLATDNPVFFGRTGPALPEMKDT